MKKIPVNPSCIYEDFLHFLLECRRDYGEREALTYFTRKGEERTFTFLQLSGHALALRESLFQRGLNGKHIAIVGENSYEWILAYLAIAASGGVAVCIDAEQPDETIRAMITTADASAVFASAPYRSICQPLLESGQISGLYLLSEEQEPGENLPQFCREGLEASPKAPLQFPDPSSTAAIFYTSGTTSTSKPVMLSHQALLHNAGNTLAYLEKQIRVYSPLPLYHTYGMTAAVLATLVRGAHIFINGDMKNLMRDLHLAKADGMCTVPLMVEAIHKGIWANAEKAGKAEELRALLKRDRLMRKLGKNSVHPALAEIRKQAVGTLNLITCGGAYLNPEIAEEFQSMGLTVIQGYGITECSPLVSINSDRYNQPESVGFVIPETEVRIVEDEIWVRGISVMNGYYKQEALTREAMEDGWFKTGDLGYLDKDGLLYITGRKKNLIVFKNGKKISPEKMEEPLRMIPLVKEVMVYGAVSGATADDVTLAATIYPDPELAAGMSSYEVLEQLQKDVSRINQDLPPYQQVQLINIREKEFEKTASRKIKRYLV